MNVKNSFPPNYEEIKSKFDLEKQKPVFTYGSTLYNPHMITIPEDLLIHESIHGEQQKHDDTIAKLWWQRYIEDTKFRIDQEIEAYGFQYAFICQKIKDRNMRFKYLHQFAIMLSSKMYGNAIGYNEAKRLIWKKSGMDKK